ncbi:hypothetical protein BGW38_008633 [Lunasporangiospora selenospora]|uniref:Uncharacterized protein n=1 Tax=Lunasporangiospora selenospora TaxID=979761 RepID=A0A9P6KIF7_9FUNG|nr:hypothetical protein BGW38_008633 [Lunasporangiospora selenospora]
MSGQPVRAVDRRFTTTAFEYPGYFIAQAHGVVRGITVRNPNAGKALIGAFASFTGGESATYIEMAEKARERAFLRMLEHAAAAGGNAVIGVQFTGQEILEVGTAGLASLCKSCEEMTEVMAYGTAVTLVPLQQQVHQQPLYSPVAAPYGSQPFGQQVPQQHAVAIQAGAPPQSHGSPVPPAKN